MRPAQGAMFARSIVVSIEATGAPPEGEGELSVYKYRETSRNTILDYKEYSIA
jgi:hypothetical protein